MRTTRLWLFRLIALCLPVVLLMLLELSLRGLFPAESMPLFKVNPAHPDYLVTEPHIVRRFFPTAAPVPAVELEPSFVLKERPAHGIRLVVQGGSTAAGYPYGLGASLAGMLEQRLRRTFPDKTVEVVNTALSAVNSYTLLDFADEIIALEPDAVLIYAGHNEYLGLLGVGSNFFAASSPRASRWLLTLRSLRTVQLIEDLVYRLKPSPPAPDSKRTVMAQVARNAEIELHSATYQAGLNQFSVNMQRLLRRYQAAGIPVYISTLASNLADQPPFQSAALTAAQQQGLAQLALLAEPQQKQQLVTTLAAEAAAGKHALLHFKLGQWYRQQGMAQQALDQFILAREHDVLRFRAPQAINQLIRELAARYGAVLVDSEAAFVAHSPQGIIGQELMLEHLHPNVQGYFLLADSFYQALHQEPVFGPWPARPVPAELAWLERPLTPAEEHAGTLRILQLTADYPFRSAPEPVVFPAAASLSERLAIAYVQGQLDWLSMQRQLAQHYHQQKDGDMLLKTLKIIADALPHDGIANLQAAQILLQARRHGEARYYAERAVRSVNPPAEAKVLWQQLAP